MSISEKEGVGILALLTLPGVAEQIPEGLHLDRLLQVLVWLQHFQEALHLASTFKEGD